MTPWQWFQLASFQVLWLCAVIGRNQWLLVPVAILSLHFVFTPNRKADFKVLSLAVAGIAVDGALFIFGVFEFSEPPLWLAILWLAFVLNLGHSLIYLRRLSLHWLLIVGALAGSYAYLISWKLGAVDLPLGAVLSGLIIAAIWALLMPVLVKADQRIRADS